MADMTLLGLAEQAANTQNVYQNQKINQMKMQAAQEEMNRQNQIRQSFANGMPNPEELYKIDPEYAAQFEQNQITSQANARNFLKGAATDLYARVSRISDPAQQQAVINQYVKPLEPQLRKMGFPMNEPITLDHLKMILGTTPEEQAQAGIASKVAEKQALFPMELQIAQARAEAMRPPVNYQTIERPEGTYRLNPQTGESGLVGGIPGKMNEPKPLQEWQRKNIDFGTRMSEANDIITEIGKNYNPEAVKIAKGLEDIPLAGYAANALISPKDQQIIQAQRQFVNSVLRPESGASISPAEFENAAKQYFPQPNDTDETIARKEQARQTAIEGLMVGIPREYMPKSKMPVGDENIQVDIQHPEKLSEEDKRLLQSDINQEKNKPKGKLKFMGFE